MDSPSKRLDYFMKRIVIASCAESEWEKVEFFMLKQAELDLIQPLFPQMLAAADTRIEEYFIGSRSFSINLYP